MEREHSNPGSPIPWWAMDIIRSVENRLGALDQGWRGTAAMVQDRFDRIEDRLDGHQASHSALTERVTRLEASAPKPSLPERLGLSVRELIGLITIASMGLGGLLQGPELRDTLLGWLK